MKKYNWWVTYWFFLVILNFVALVVSASNGDALGASLSGFMFIFCGLALNENLNKKEDS